MKGSEGEEEGEEEGGEEGGNVEKVSGGRTCGVGGCVYRTNESCNMKAHKAAIHAIDIVWRYELRETRHVLTNSAFWRQSLANDTFRSPVTHSRLARLPSTLARRSFTRTHSRFARRYLLYRWCRGDLHYWLPLEGKTGWFLSVSMRIVVKIVVDFTGCEQFRHPQELGGLSYSLTLLQAQVGSAVFAKLYVYASDGDADALAVDFRQCKKRTPVHRGEIQESQFQRSWESRGSSWNHAQVLEKRLGRVAQAPGGEVDSVGAREAEVVRQGLDRQDSRRHAPRTCAGQEEIQRQKGGTEAQ